MPSSATNAYIVPISREMAEDIEAMRPIHEMMRQTFNDYIEDSEFARIHGPQLRPTRREYDAIMEPARRRQRKIRSLRSNHPGLARVRPGSFVRPS